MNKMVPDYDVKRACFAAVLAVDSTTRDENGLITGVVLQYKCATHGKVTIVLGMEDAVDVAVWSATQGALLWGEEFREAFDVVAQVAGDFRDALIQEEGPAG